MNTSNATLLVAPAYMTYHDKLGSPFEIREYQSADRGALSEFYQRFEPKRAAQGLPPSDSRRIDTWLASILATGIHLLAVRGAELIGHAFVVPTQRTGIGEYAVFLRQDLRGRGIGTAINRAVVEAARAAGLRGLWLTVEPRNRAAIRSYEKVGLRIVPKTIFSTEAEMEMEL